MLGSAVSDLEFSSWDLKDQGGMRCAADRRFGCWSGCWMGCSSRWRSRGLRVRCWPVATAPSKMTRVGSPNRSGSRIPVFRASARIRRWARRDHVLLASKALSYQITGKRWAKHERGKKRMRRMRSRWFRILTAVAALLMAGSALSGCDNSKPAPPAPTSTPG